MKVRATKYVHSCLLVETPDRVAIFDPGVYSEEALNVNDLKQLDDIFITHEHADHNSLPLIKQLFTRFPKVRITTTPNVVSQLAAENIIAETTAPEDVQFFNSPHEGHLPFIAPPQQIGIHYLDMLSDPGDSHSFTETKEILALPITAPWGSTMSAIDIAVKLKPKYVLPIHDWFWRDEARTMLYDRLEKMFEEQGMKFFKLETGRPIEIEI
jgi:L-ascorbate metabolism protein UlaG (beta-lactamase superfamily)